MLELIVGYREETEDSRRDDFEIKGHIEFKSVTFAYPQRPLVPVLNGITLNIGAKQVFALVGMSGSGKTTLFQLLERFYKPGSGAIYLDGVNIRKIKSSHLRRSIAYVSQAPSLFNRSILENIRYGSSKSTREQIEDAARRANVHDFIMTLPQGYDTYVGDKGVQLSGGQRQRIAIARALLRQPKILLLDEYTSALDNESEKLIQESIDRLKKTMTMVIIAHRLTTVRSADKIAFLSSGVIAEIGSHRELIAKQGAYYELSRTRSDFLQA
jgi:ABC-type multidrug transport system fused ATPase/permease subunit